MKFFENFKFSNLFSKKKIDENILDKFEELLIESDVGTQIAADLKERFKKEKIGKEIKDEKEIFDFLAEQISKILNPFEGKLNNLYKVSPSIIVVAGVNGVGKTTTIGKLGKLFKNQGKKIVFGAADTFRAAAIEQLEVWSKKIGAEFVKSDLGIDPASVGYKTVKFAEDNKLDMAFIDTAGRLHNKTELMDELKKIVRTIQKNDPDAPQHKLLVLDSTIGQNTYAQLEAFNSYTGITGIIMTKLDSSSKGGALIGISKKFNIPIYFLGVGEKIEDLIDFSAKDFINALIGNNFGEKDESLH